MRKLIATLCVIGSTFALSACETSSTSSYDSGANFATGRTAGEVDAVAAPAPARAERVFREVQSK